MVELSHENARLPRQADEPAARGRTVLIADEESPGRRRLVGEFGQHGFEVHVSDGSAAAEELALRVRPALMVLELRLRSGSGLLLLSTLRPQLPATRFVVVTSFGSVATAVRAMRAGAAGYFCKPCTVGHMLAAIDDVLIEGEGSSSSCPLTLDLAIWEYIHETIEMSGSLSEAARRLGLWRRSLKRMIDKYRPEAEPPAEVNGGRALPRGTPRRPRTP